MRGLVITTKQVDDATVLTLAGSASMHELDRLTRETDRCAAGRPRRLVVDMSGLEFMASLAIGQIVAMHHAVALHGGKVILAAPCEDVMGVLKRCNIPAVIPVTTSVDAALKA